jgi:hypothetical protein
LAGTNELLETVDISPLKLPKAGEAWQSEKGSFIVQKAPGFEPSPGQAANQMNRVLLVRRDAQ